jgi:dTDP-4-dehydrorhamnose 3,5-epimerase
MTVETGREAPRLPGVWSTGLTVHHDTRGQFVEWFRTSRVAAATGANFVLAQANLSVSGRGVIRGVHYFADDNGQAKYVTCAHGEVLDVVVDLRVGSPSFGQWRAVRMSQAAPQAVYVPRGLGHAFVALSDQAVMLYLCDAQYVPGVERTIHPLDPELALPWPADLPRTISDRDLSAPSLCQARKLGLLAGC